MNWARRAHQGKTIILKLRPAVGLFPLLTLLSALAVPVDATAGQVQNEQRVPLGSLTVTGAAQLNGASAPARSTVSVGDALNTDQGGTATLMIAGRGSIKVYPESQIAFSGNSGYVAELLRGTAVTNTSMGASGVALRIGDYVVRAAPDSSQAAAMVRLEKDGSSLVSCVAGSVQVVALQGDTSLVLKTGQSASVSTVRQAIATQATPSSGFPGGKVRRATRHHWRLIVLGLAGGAAAAAAVALTGTGSASISTSPAPSPSPIPAPGPAPPSPPSPTPPSPTPTPPSPPPPPSPPQPGHPTRGKKK